MMPKMLTTRAAARKCQRMLGVLKPCYARRYTWSPVGKAFIDYEHLHYL